MNFFNPLAWAGLVALPIILAMYLLKQKFTPKPVPSLFLWKAAMNMSLSQRPWQKLRRSLLLFLQLLLAFCLVFALARPYVTATASVSKTLLVLDASFSMQAMDGDDKHTVSRFEKAKADMLGLVADMKPGAEATLVVLGQSPYIAMNATQDKKALSEEIRRIQPAYTGVDEAAATSLLAMLAGDEQAAVCLFSDKAYALEGVQPPQLFLYGTSQQNMAVTLLSTHQDSDRVVLLAKVKNCGTQRQDNTMAVYADSALHDMKDISLAPGEEKDVFFTDLPGRTVQIEAKLVNPDVLPGDDVGYTLVESTQTRRVVLVTEQNVFLENVLSLMPGVELVKVAPENMGEALTGGFLYVFDGVLPEEAFPTDGHLLVFNPPEGNALVEAGAEVPVTGLYATDSSLLALIGDLQFDVAKARTLAPNGWGEVLLASDETPLIVTGLVNSQKLVVMGFDLHNTDLPLKKEFPVFMYNIMQYFNPGGPLAAGALFTGQTVNVGAAPNATQVRALQPDDSMVTLSPPFPALPLALEQPGVYTLVQETSTETLYNAFAVNVAMGESDLTRAGDQAGGQTVGAQQAPVAKNLAPFVLGLVLVLLLGEWWVFGRGR